MAVLETANRAMKISRSLGFSTLLIIIISGKDSAVTAIINAKAVPMGISFPIKTATNGIIPAAFDIKALLLKLL